VHRILNDVGDAARFVFRHFPLTTAHPHAESAAEAAEAAGSQDRYWQMHDVLFANQRDLAGPQLMAYASALGLDVSRFISETASHAHLPKISDDFMSGVQSGVNGTPTFYVNGTRHDRGWDYASLMSALQKVAFTVSG
jgi:protein-disulfide isomerase